jgi:hypothetical protein
MELHVWTYLTCAPLPVPLPPRAVEPKGGDAGQPYDANGLGCKGDTGRNNLYVRLKYNTAILLTTQTGHLTTQTEP